MSSPRADGANPSEIANPYIGLRPYKESESQWFFGRDADRKIFVDMLLANRLTLLFAASGVGKSSLLQASVLPYLKDPTHENLDAVYCNNWAGNPMVSIRAATLTALAARKRIPAEAMSTELSALPLPRFFSLCSHFSRQPLIIVLDQFEEFFHYHRSAPQFNDYKEQLVQLIGDESIAVSIVISMREDFALSLNAFKPELPTILFNKFYRLEKLTRADAESAIVRPAEMVGFKYEPALLTALLTDLAARERIGRPGSLVAESALNVEPPYLQIVCSQLFELDRNDPERTLRLGTYQSQGGAQGLLASHIDRVTAALSYPERKLASQCFSHLITRRGTKVAHTADSLARELRVDRNRLELVLRELENARLLRSQSQDQQTWFELYHDLFSDSVDQWNERFKSRERRRKTLFSVSAILTGGTLLYGAWLGTINAANSHLRLSVKGDANTQVELYHGRAETPDPFAQQSYVGETGIIRQQIEADLRFKERPLTDVSKLYSEWAKVTPDASRRMKLYRSDGDIDSALLAARGILISEDETRARTVISDIAKIGSQRGFDNELAFALSGGKSQPAVRAMSSVLNPDLNKTDFLNDRVFIDYQFPPGRTAVEFLVKIISDPKSALRPEAARMLGARKAAAAAQPLAALLCQSMATVSERGAAAGALTKIGSVAAVWPLSCKLGEQPEEVQVQIVDMLGALKVRDAASEIEHYIAPNYPTALRVSSLKALGKLGTAPRKLEPYLADTEEEIAVAAAAALEQSGHSTIMPALRTLILSAKEATAQVRLATSLARLGDSMPLSKTLSEPKARQRIFSYFTERDSRYSNYLEYNCETNDSLLQLLASDAQALEGAMDGAEVHFQKRLVKCLNYRFPSGSGRLLAQLAFAPDVELNRLAAKGLVDSDDALALPTLQRMLRGDVNERRVLAARSLGRLSSPRATETLLSVAVNRAEPSLLRAAALRALAAQGRRMPSKHPGTTFVIQLRQAIKDPTPELRSAGAAALAANLPSEAIHDLIALLGDGEESVRNEALRQIFELRSPLAVAALDSFLAQADSKKDKDILLNARELLGRDSAVEELTARLTKLLPPDGSPPPSASRTEIRKSLNKLSELGRLNSALPLTLAIESKAQEVVSTGLETVTNLGDSAWRDSLARLLFSGESETQSTALSAYVGMALPRDISAVSEQLESSSLSLQEYQNMKNLMHLESSLLYDRYGMRLLRELRRYSSSYWTDFASCTKASAIIASDKYMYWKRLDFSEIQSRMSKSEETSFSSTRLNDVIRELATDDWHDKSQAIYDFRKLAGSDSIVLLLDLLDRSTDKGRGRSILLAVAELSAKNKEQRAIKRLVDALANYQDQLIDGRLHASVRSLTAGLSPEALVRAVGQERTYEPLLAAACQPAARESWKTPSYLTIWQRVQAARMVSGSGGECSDQVLAPLSRDSSVRVRIAATTALGGLKTGLAITELHRLIGDPNPRVQLAAATALTESAVPASVPKIREVLFNAQTPVLVLQQLLRALGAIGNQDAINLLFEAAKTAEQTMGLRAYRILGDLHSRSVLPGLNEQLEKHKKAAAYYRWHRDHAPPENPQAQAKPAATASQPPSSFLLFELGVAIARLSNEEEIVQLLHHDLADVREGAALGAALRGSPSLVKTLDAQRFSSSDPLFRHSAYQTLDTTLEVIETLGGAAELQALREMQVQLHDHNGVLTRVQWTIHELEGRVNEQKASSKAAPQGSGGPRG